MQTDIKTNHTVLNSLGRMIEVQLREDLGSVGESKRAQIVLNEFIELVYLKGWEGTESNLP